MHSTPVSLQDLAFSSSDMKRIESSEVYAAYQRH